MRVPNPAWKDAPYEIAWFDIITEDISRLDKRISNEESTLRMLEDRLSRATTLHHRSNLTRRIANCNARIMALKLQRAME